MFAPEIAMLFTYDTTPLEVGGYYIMFSKQLESSDKLAKVFDSGIKKLKESGKYEEITQKFLNLE